MPSWFRCLIRLRYVVVTPDVCVLLRSWLLIFSPVIRLPAPRREPMSTQISCFWAQVSENFVSDIIESLSFVPAAFDRSPQAWVFRRTGRSRWPSAQPARPFHSRSHSSFGILTISNRPVTIFSIRMKSWLRACRGWPTDASQHFCICHPRLFRKAAPSCSLSVLRNSMRRWKKIELPELSERRPASTHRTQPTGKTHD